MPQLSDLRPGDILVQCKGEPWRTGSHIFTGHPYPHAMLVTYNGCDGVYILEDGPFGVEEKEFGREWDGFTTFPLDHYEIWRPRCDQETKDKAIEWARKRRGEGYGYFRLALVLALYRVKGAGTVPGWDDDPRYDNRKKICSELIAMAYYRSGYDVVPHISDSNTMPWDLRNPVTCDLVGV